MPREQSRLESKEVVFDRGGFIYHGKIKALADAAREAGVRILIRERREHMKRSIIDASQFELEEKVSVNQACNKSC